MAIAWRQKRSGLAKPGLRTPNARAGRQMKAAWYEEQGEPAKVFKIGELPDGSPGPGEVRVKVHASGANPTDTYTRSGARRALTMP